MGNNLVSGLAISEPLWNEFSVITGQTKELFDFFA